MNEILLFIGAWIFAGFGCFILGSAIDYSFYKIRKIEWKWSLLCTALGPIMLLVILRVLYITWKDRRDEKKPCNLKACFKALDKMLTGLEKEDAKRHLGFAVKNHHSLGRHLRNEWGLWAGGPLKDYFNKLGIHHADDMSGIILRSYHEYLNGKNIKLNAQIKSCQDYWANMNNEEDTDGQGK